MRKSQIIVEFANQESIKTLKEKESYKNKAILEADTIKEKLRKTSERNVPEV